MSNYQTWANYFVKYINAYQDAGIKITQVSLQNEPNAGAPGTIFKWQETYWSPETANEFLSEYRRHHNFPHIPQKLRLNFFPKVHEKGQKFQNLKPKNCEFLIMIFCRLFQLLKQLV